MVEYLIDKGAAITNVLDKNNNTLLMMFINQGSDKILTMLLQNEQNELIDIYWKNNNGDTALSLLTTRYRLASIVQFCQYIMTNSHRFGGEKRVCQYIIDNKAVPVILGLRIGDATREQLIQMAKKYQIWLPGCR